MQNENENESFATITSKDEFKSLSTDGKLVTLFDMMWHVRGLSLRVDRSVHRDRQHIDENTRRIKVLEYKSIDAEARSRRNNLIFRGVAESSDAYENCEQQIKTLLRDKLEVDPDSCVIQRAHRLGRKIRGATGARPLIVCFRDYSSIDAILQSAHKLRNTRVSVNRDYPAEISTARSKLWPSFKDAKRNNPRGSVKLVYPAKLIVNGRVEQDEFPDWNDIMSGRRVGPVKYGRGPDSNAQPQHSHIEVSDAESESSHVSDRSMKEDSQSLLPQQARNPSNGTTGQTPTERMNASGTTNQTSTSTSQAHDGCMDRTIPEQTGTGT